MNKSIKKLFSILLATVIITASLTFSFSVNASEYGKVRVIVRNDTYTTEEGAPWDGVLVDEWIELDETSTMMTAFIEAVTKNGYTQVGGEKGYITEVNGLAAGDNDFMSGWMGTINDWFSNELFGYYTVKDGTLKSGDEICIAYTSDWGEDLGSSWYNNYTTLKSLEVNGGTLTNVFDSAVNDYTLEINSPTTNITVNPTATNKNFQVRTYKNEYTPALNGSEYKRNTNIEVSSGDTIYIGVGDPLWPSMGTSEQATVYTLKVEYKRLLGDVNADGEVNIIDVTEIQKQIAKLITMDDAAKEAADFNGDKVISVIDITEIQRYIVHNES